MTLEQLSARPSEPAADGEDRRDDEAAPVVVVDGVSYEFPGCRAMRISRNEIVEYDGRIEYWDADTETALMVCEPAGPYHERPTVRLARMVDRISATWGTEIEALGASDLLVRDGAGERHRIMQADQIVFSHPGQARPLGNAVEVLSDDLPDVVLEVDLTTDVRRGKLRLYESWGFPEVWVEVPDRKAPSSPRNRAPGLTIHVLGDNGYEEAPSSRAFPTWTAEEIHAGMNEERTRELPISAATAAVLRRVGRLLRASTGTGPDDDPFLRAEREESRMEGHATGRAEGHATGRAEGLATGRAEVRVEMLRSVFQRRGMRLSPGFGGYVETLGAVPVATLLQAAEECRDEADFRRRLAT